MQALTITPVHGLQDQAQRFFGQFYDTESGTLYDLWLTDTKELIARYGRGGDYICWSIEQAEKIMEGKPSKNHPLVYLVNLIRARKATLNK